jgi:hypothetical protein
MRKIITENQQKLILKKAMVLDRSDKRKSEEELQKEIEELKLMKNRDENDIKMLKVELNKLSILYKKYKEIGGVSATGNLIQMPERFINQ